MELLHVESCLWLPCQNHAWLASWIFPTLGVSDGPLTLLATQASSIPHQTPTGKPGCDVVSFLSPQICLPLCCQSNPKYLRLGIILLLCLTPDKRNSRFFVGQLVRSIYLSDILGLCAFSFSSDQLPVLFFLSPGVFPGASPFPGRLFMMCVPATCMSCSLHLKCYSPFVCWRR